MFDAALTAQPQHAEGDLLEITPSGDVSRLLEIMSALRNPAGGCPWDLQQDFRSIAPYTVEEAYEVADAIERGSMTDLRDELGDLLLQVVFHSQMASELDAFAFPDVVKAITAKMIRRHPHVFGPVAADGAMAAKRSWNDIKSLEKAQRAASRDASVAGKSPEWLDDVPLALPALTRALKLQQRASEVGFDWAEAAPILAKVDEELGEFRVALDAGDTQEVRAEFGDLLFSLVNLARHLGIDAEDSLRRTNDKFRRRFGYVERGLSAVGSSLKAASLQEMEALWQEAKAETP